MGNEVASHAPQVSIHASAQEAPIDMQFETDHIVQFGTMQIDTDIDNYSSVYLPGMGDVVGDGEINWSTLYGQPPMATLGDQSSRGATSSPTLQYQGRSSPISQFLNAEFFDTRPSFGLITNLPWFKLQTTLDQLDFTNMQIHSLQHEVLSSPPRMPGTLPPETRQGVLLNLLGPVSDQQLAGNISMFADKLQRFIPERCEGDLSCKIAHILDSRSTSLASLSTIFNFAAYFASNNKLEYNRMDTFLKWVIDQKCTEHLERFLQIKTPTVHAFATQVLKSAVRIKNIKFLATLMDIGVKFDSILDQILRIGDVDFINLVLSRVSTSCFDGQRGIELFDLCVAENHFDIARTFVAKGVSVDGLNNTYTLQTPLLSAVARNDVHAVTFLLELGADVNKGRYVSTGYQTPLAKAVLREQSDIVAVLLKHGANTSCKVEKQDIMQWCSLNCRNIYRLLQEHVGAVDVGFTTGDLIHAANEGNNSLDAYLESQLRTVSNEQLEEALGESISLGYTAATEALLEHGVSPNSPSLETPPLQTALQFHKRPHRVCKLLIKHKANVNGFNVLKDVVFREDLRLLQMFIIAGVDLEEEGMEALVKAAEVGHIPSAAFLLHSGVDINTPGLEENPLQAAARLGELKMIQFLLDRGADVNAPAYLSGGRTPLQAALRGEAPETAWLLLDRGADVFSPPALVGGVTAIEGICHNRSDDPTYQLLPLCNYLLDSNAPVTRPNGKPSSALHGAIQQGWDGILARMLEPQRGAIINHMWCDQENEYTIRQPRTPTQLAADRGEFGAVKMLVGRGADVNEAPGYLFGRTALQAATSKDEPDMALVQFLLDNGADVNAKPAPYGGITALQGAAISGDIMLAKLLFDKGADVNGALPTLTDGVTTMADQHASNSEPVSAAEILASGDCQVLEVPQGTPKLEYRRLPSLTSFRLLQILSEGGEDILRCRMFDAQLGTPGTPRYIALSYTWHEESLPRTFRPILINGKSLDISLNLWNFLENYRHTTGERIIWIDQICINQDDMDERVQQIGQMCAIYEQASMDLFWIGEPDENTEAVMDILELLARLEVSHLASDHQRPGIDALLNPIYMYAIGLPMYPTPIWGSLMHFISRSAFQRAWIIQEIAVSQKASIFCGLLMLPFDVLGRAAMFLVESGWIKALHTEYNVSGAAGFLTGMLNCRVRHQGGERQSLELLLASTRRFKATEPVDKVFALMNLAERGRTTPLPPLLQPDYRKSVVEVFQGVTLHLISQGSLDVLSGIEDEIFRHFRQLPSWVPDYSVHQVLSILCMPPRAGTLTLYAAATGRHIRSRYSPADPNTLTLSSYKFDTIEKIAPLEDQANQLRLENWACMVDFGARYPTVDGKSNVMIDAFWRTLIGNIGLGIHEYPVSQEWIHHFATFASQAREELSQHLSSSNATRTEESSGSSFTPGIDSIISALRNVPPVAEPSEKDGRRFETTMHHVSWSRRLFVTNAGFMGLAPPSAQPGDVVVLLSGGRVPFIVRKGAADSSEYYRIVGETYVHGIMDGELLSTINSEWVDLSFR
ncbi:hypothetical protein NM208_g870 [Fusarium decemcellulare]|uniref:Uncharacterized protein n=1 Tax=Fusarium decemcellulare TaxID=57161 RepID=A0ACC1SY92_9HYPO|nr:hypothetical protein NM208_g870 [Fusarium decemcellulare]